jgi:hypothetical protein
MLPSTLRTQACHMRSAMGPTSEKRFMHPFHRCMQIEAIYHTSIVVGGVEHFYGGGIQEAVPGHTPYGQPIQVLELGYVSLHGMSLGLQHHAAAYCSIMRNRVACRETHLPADVRQVRKATHDEMHEVSILSTAEGITVSSCICRSSLWTFPTASHHRTTTFSITMWVMANASVCLHCMVALTLPSTLMTSKDLIQLDLVCTVQQLQRRVCDLFDWVWHPAAHHQPAIRGADALPASHLGTRTASS